MALFDFETQAGITHVLASIRASKISPAQKNELRDIVFLYANGGHDQSVKLSLEQKLSAYAVEALPNARFSRQAPMYTIGGTRQSPVDFAVVNTVKITPPPVAPIPPPAQYVPPPIPTAPPPPVAAPYVPPAPVIPVAVPTPPPPPVIPPPAPYVPPAQVAPIVTSSIQPPQQVDFPAAGEQQLQRIREIKSLVNEQVGNPVNLIDIDNEAGREYMGALLDAMKKLNSGTSSVAAMQRLEQAYKTVDAAIKRHKNTAAQSNVKPMTQSVPPPPVTPTPPPAPYVPPPIPVVPPTPVAAPYVPPAPKPFIPPPPRPIAVETKIAQVVPTKPVTSQSPDDRSDAWESTKPSTSAFADSKLTSLAESKLRTQPVAAPVVASTTSTDPLLSPEIDSGLDQLLSEWSLFKKSGLFGTGPKGREHPLFKKVATLQIPLLLAGRFEGATQEIKQSITDYMNGWRYEQGIIYMPGETFERYLRRVIRHILDLQKKPART